MDSMSRQWPVNQSLILSRHAQRGQQMHLKPKTGTRKLKVDQ